jgi:hypothetical protein
MPIVKRANLEFALKNVAQYGDTDIFPFPLENHWFHDQCPAVVDLLENIDENFEEKLGSYPVHHVKSLAGVGYFGFRTATQIDPIWNAYLLGLMIEIGDDIEAKRVSSDRGAIHAYRFRMDPNKYTLFSPDYGWASFQQTALKHAESSKYILFTDISDFYYRIYHHRLENALKEATRNLGAVNRIMVLLKKLSTGNSSYGIPVGGNAARILAELLLNRADKLLLAHNVRFCRFVDDYYLFAESREEVQRLLITLSEALLLEGLSIARSKTRLMSKSEFLRSSPIAEHTVAESEIEAEALQLLKLRLTYDPYSLTGEEDYLKLRDELEHFNIVGMLAREINKSRIDEVLIKQLIKAIRFLKSGVREQAVESIIDNIEVLYPVFPTIAILLKRLIDDVDKNTAKKIFSRLRKLLRDQSHVILVPNNLAFVVRLLAYDDDDASEALLIQAYERSDINANIKRDVLLAMARRKAGYWLSEKLHRFVDVTPWERRALIVASYILGDEGKHWRSNTRAHRNAIEEKFSTWVADKNNGKVWEIPL